MGSAFVVAGRRFRRRSTIKLLPAEKAALAACGSVALRRPVHWPLPDSAARLDRAWVDPGGTDLWGDGPYLKVPNGPAADDAEGEEVVNRVFCPWGYPPDRLRVAWSTRYLRLERVELARVGPTAWELRLTVKDL